MDDRRGVRSQVRRRCARLLGAVLVLLSAMWAWASPALASHTQQSILMDDQELIYAPLPRVEQAMARIRSLGFDVIRVSVVWELVAPDPHSDQEPAFDATDPAAYPDGAWTRYDELVELAQQFGLRVYFQLTAPAPAWATVRGPDGPGTHPWSRRPNANEFQQFAQAVGTRYDGSYVPPGGASSPAITVSTRGLAIPSPDPATQPQTPGALPAVRWWSIWNEPNDQAWLSPQYHRVYGREAPWSPLQYRDLIDAGYAGLAEGGHADDTILIGETSSGRAVHTLPFMRELYCVNNRLQMLQGLAAQRLGCPTTPDASTFVSDHPGLFNVTGWAEHPYFFSRPPNARPARGVLTLRNLGVLRNLLAGLFSTYEVGPGLPIYITEYGYKTRPPNPYANTSLHEQEVYLNEGEYMAWRIPWVNSMAQFELVDDGPRTQYRRGSLQYWSTFQTGLMFANGRPKPAYAAYRMPIWVPSPHPGRSVSVWGSLRPSDHSQLQQARVEYRRSGGSTWTTIDTFDTLSPESYFNERVRIPRPGMIRLAWENPLDGTTVYSRPVEIHR